ncbi:MAG: hypothetical protein NT154_16705, partial [Verrucomicrobia bacterium]|nr:hypothetical protein [Verrucomicrobiota bacterium]
MGGIDLVGTGLSRQGNPGDGEVAREIRQRGDDAPGAAREDMEIDEFEGGGWPKLFVAWPCIGTGVPASAVS